MAAYTPLALNREALNKSTMPEPEGTTPNAGGANASTPTENGGTNNQQGNAAHNEGNGGTTPKTFTQEEVNAIVANEKREHLAKMEKLRAAGLSDEQITAIEKQDAAAQAESSLKAVQQERVKLLLEKHHDAVSKLDTEQVEKLKASNPDDVQKLLENLSAIIGSGKSQTTPPNNEQGGMPSMAGGTPPANVSQEVLTVAEGMEDGIRTGDFRQAINGLFGNL